MRQLGHHRLEHQPGRDKPGEQEARAGLAPRLPHRRRRQSCQHRAWPKRQPEQHEIEPRRGAVRFLTVENLGQHVFADRLFEKARTGLGHDGGKPRQHQNDHPGEAHERSQRPEPAAGAVGNRQRQRGQADEQQDHRPFQQHTDAERGPQNRRQLPADFCFRLAAVAEIDARHGAHGGDAGEQQHGIGLGKARLDAEQHATRHHQRRQQRGAAHDKRKCGPVGQQHRADGAEQRG